MEKVAEFVQVTSPEAKMPLVCRVVERHYREGKTIAVHAGSADEAKEIDQTLWTYRQGSFVPHVRLAEAEEPLCEPVVIAVDGEAVPESDVLVCLSRSDPAQWIGQFDCVCDFAETYDEKLREAARQRFAAYRDAGYRMRYVK